MTRWVLVLVGAIWIATEARAAGKPCSFAWRPFADGATSCQEGRQFRCVDGAWRQVGTSCAGDGPADAGVGVQPPVEQPTVQQPPVAQPGVQ